MNGLDRLNLSSRPFINRRPRKRIRSILWTLAALLFLVNGFLFAHYWIGSAQGRNELREVRGQVDERVERLRTLETRLGSFDLDAQNRQVRFLNRKIIERTFPWSRLFDHIVDVLPNDVRLVGIAPALPQERRRGRTVDVEVDIDWIDLRFRAVAKSSEDVLDLLDALFSHNYFERPLLTGESENDEGVGFDIYVRYKVVDSTDPGPDDAETEPASRATTTASSQQGPANDMDTGTHTQPSGVEGAGGSVPARRAGVE